MINIINLILTEHKYWESLRKSTDNFEEKNRYVVGEVACERLIHQLKELGYEIHPNE